MVFRSPADPLSVVDNDIVVEPSSEELLAALKTAHHELVSVNADLTRLVESVREAERVRETLLDRCQSLEKQLLNAVRLLR